MLRLIEIDKSSIFHAVEDVKKVMSDNEIHSDKEFDFISFKAKNEDFLLAAVDGSHHNIRGNNFVFSTLRAGYHIYQGENIIKSEIDPIKIELLANNDDHKIGYLVKHEAYYHSITGELPRGKMEFEKATERIRTLMEWDKVKSLIYSLNKGDIIIFDGSLISGQISTSHDFFNHLVEKAKEKGIALVGLSKDTSLSIDSASLPIVLLEASKKHFPDKNWLVQYNDSYFVKFTRFKDLVFRLDVIIPEGTDIEEIVSKIAAYSMSRTDLGYPFPMRKIHDSVRISELERDHCFDQFKNECLKSKIPSHVIEKMFHIYHDDLDKMSFGR